MGKRLNGKVTVITRPARDFGLAIAKAMLTCVYIMKTIQNPRAVGVNR
jgi:hypothetical protein